MPVIVPSLPSEKPCSVPRAEPAPAAGVVAVAVLLPPNWVTDDRSTVTGPAHDPNVEVGSKVNLPSTGAGEVAVEGEVIFPAASNLTSTSVGAGGVPVVGSSVLPFSSRTLSFQAFAVDVFWKT